MNIRQQIARSYSNVRRGIVILVVAIPAFFMQGCIESDFGIVLPWELPNWDIAWSEAWKGTQIQEMVAVGMAMDEEGSTYSVGQMNLEDGSRWGVVVKYNRFGVKEAQRIFQASGDNQTLVRDVTADSDGNLYITGERQDAGNWFVTKIDGKSPTLDILWDVTRFGGSNKGSPYTIAVGDNAVVAAGSSSDWNRYAVSIWDAQTGAHVWEWERGCCSNGIIKDPRHWDAIAVEQDGSKESFYVTYPGHSGSTSNPTGMRVERYTYNAGVITGSGYDFDLDSIASNYRFEKHPEGGLVFAGNKGNTAKVFKIDIDDNDLINAGNISSIIAFDKKFRFRAMTFDEMNSLYISGDTINEDSPDNTNAYIAKYDASCIDVHTKLCWDQTFNHTMLFNISVSLMGIPLVETFTKEEVRDVFIANNFVYMMTSSETSNANVASQQVTELIGFSKGSGNPANQIQIKASDSAAAMLNPYNPERVHVVGVNVNADLTADPDIYLYTHAVLGF